MEEKVIGQLGDTDANAKVEIQSLINSLYTDLMCFWGEHLDLFKEVNI